MAKKSKSGSGKTSGFPSAPELIVIAAPDAGLRATATEVASASGVSTKSLNSLLKGAQAVMSPIFGSEPRVAASRAASAAAAAASLPELTSYYSVEVEPAKMGKLAAELRKNPTVQAAFVKPPAFPPVWIDDKMEDAAAAAAAPDGEEAPTASFIPNQLYLEVAPGGIDARYAWTRVGGKGQGVRVVDVEGAWRFTHEDLLQNQGGVIGGTPSADIGWRNHGTSVVGVFGGDENAFGVTGIAPLANTRAVSIFGTGMGSATAIRRAADALSAGDIILIELHRQGPDGNGTGQDGFIAVEWWPDDFAAIVYAVSRGVIVIEAAGNGARNLDAAVFNTRPAGFPATWRNPFNLANPQSGAVVVGAGAPPPGTHGRDHGPDRSRLGFSNFGARVDVQGWGREVTSSGGSHVNPGDLQGGTNEDLWYTDQFSGTSSASPVVVGAVACLQGALRAASRPLLTPATARNILRTTGSPQTDAPGRPATQRIGNRPNLRQALLQLIPIIKIKENIKAEKNEKLELKAEKNEKFELKDKNEKLERKEIKEHKLEKNEKIEQKERKEFEKIKNEKFEQKERKEKPEKEVFEKLQDKAFEIPTSEMGEMGGTLEDRVSQLEQGLAALSHFIPGELRPDLGSSALNQEEDIQALYNQMTAQAEEAKATKDVRDVS